MIWKILRPHYWILYRRVRAANAIVAVTFLLFGLLGGQWFFDNVIGRYLVMLSSEHAATAVANSLPIGLFITVVFVVLGYGDVLYQLYLAPDIELLMAAPIPYPTIFLYKLSQCSRAPLIPALGIGACLTLLGLARNAPPIHFLLIALLTVMIVILATALVMILVLSLTRWLPARGTRSWIPLFVVLLTFALMIGQPPATKWIQSQERLIKFFTEALVSPQKLGIILAGSGSLSVLIVLVALRIFVTTYHEGWNRYGDVPTKQGAISRPVSRRSSIARRLSSLSSPMRFILDKEWLELRRNPRSLLNLVQPLVLVSAVLTLFAGAGNRTSTLRPLILYSMLMFLALFLTTQPIGTSLMAISQEGRNFSVLRAAPISMSLVLKGKLWATWVPVGMAWTLVLLAAGVLLRLPIWQIAFLVGIALLGLAGASTATMAIGGLKVDFNAEDLRQRTSLATNYLAMGLNATISFLTITTGVWLIVHLFPASNAVLAIKGLASYPALCWFFSDNMGVPLGMLAAQVAFWIVIKLLWDSAVCRLENWEVA